MGSQFCADLASGNYADAYSLLSQKFIDGATEAQIAAAFTLPAPLKWGGCTPDLSTYKVSGTSASFNAALQVVDSSTGTSASVNFTLSFVQGNGSWKLDDMTKA